VADPASEAQIRFINKLISEKDTSKIGTFPTRTMNEIQAGSEVSKSRASSLITALKNALPKAQTSAPEIQTPATPAQTSASQVRTQNKPAPVTEDGMYQTPAGEIYKVQVAKQGSGRLYAKKLTEFALEDGGTEWAFEFVKGGIYRLTADMKMSLEQAQEFGKLYGVCCRCAADLTDEKSINAGIGPICAGKM